MKIKTKVIYHCTLTRMAKIKTLSVPSADKNVEELEQLCITGRDKKWFNHFGKRLDSFLKISHTLSI